MSNASFRFIIGMAAALASGAALGAGTFNAGAAVGTMPLAKDTADGFFAKALTIPPGATSFAACAQKVNGQLRIADASGCHPSEIAVTLGAGGTTPVEVSRVLTIPPGSGGQFNGIFGGLLCPAGRTQVSGGYQVLRQDIKVQESFIGPGFGLPRVYIISTVTFTFAALPEGDVVKMWSTCL